MSSSSRVKRTYSSRQNRLAPPSSPPSDLAPPSLSAPRKRVHTPDTNADYNDRSRAPKRRALVKSPRVLSSSRARVSATREASHGAPPRKQLTQLHFSLDTTTFRTCSLCGLSYTRAAPEDEALHKVHCARVQRGMEWGREEEREWRKTTVDEVARDVRLKDGRVGRVVCFRADIGGKIGSKLKTLLDTVNVALSSPPLTAEVLKTSKAYVFLLPSPRTPSRERIVGCVIAQHIESAMALASEEQITAARANSPSSSAPPGCRTLIPIHIDPTASLYVHPDPLPCALGIPRLFVSSAHRRQGIALHLLTAAAATFVHGYALDPARGEVAFSQPTNLGRAVMDRWGKGGIRIYEE